MSLLLQQLEATKVLSYHDGIITPDFNRLAENAWLWRIQYQVQCAHLITAIHQGLLEEPTLIKTIQDTEFMARLLESLYDRLNECAITIKFHQDKLMLQTLLKQQMASATKKTCHDLPNFVQKTTYHTDTIRLLLGQLRRISMALSAFPNTLEQSIHWTQPCWDFLAPILGFASFLIYVPRSVVHATLLANSCTDHQGILWRKRLQARSEINDRLYNLINDFPSILSGFIALFILTSATIWLAAYIAIAVKAMEVIATILKNNHDLSRLDTLRTAYHQQPSPHEIDHIFLKELDHHIAYIRGTRSVNLAMHELLLGCLFAFVPPIMILHPWVPVFAASFALALVCLRLPIIRDYWISASPPHDDLNVLRQTQRFFDQRNNSQQTASRLPKLANLDLTRQRPPDSI